MKNSQLAAKIKSERNTYRKPASQAIPQLLEDTEIPITEYLHTEEIERMTDKINRLLETENTDKNAVAELIIKCAQLKYSAIKEVIK